MIVTVTEPLQEAVCSEAVITNIDSATTECGRSWIAAKAD